MREITFFFLAYERQGKKKVRFCKSYMAAAAPCLDKDFNTIKILGFAKCAGEYLYCHLVTKATWLQQFPRLQLKSQNSGLC